jgi:hypothetical protein
LLLLLVVVVVVVLYVVAVTAVLVRFPSDGCRTVQSVVPELVLVNVDDGDIAKGRV